MKSRKITIISSKAQKKYVIMSDAETLKDLKVDLDKENIDYADMTFMEGITKSEFNNDNAVLPQNVEYRGKKTNELVFMLTKSEKKIKSGARNLERLKYYDYIKTHNLQSKCVEKYNKNFTQLKTQELYTIVNEDKNNISCASPNSMTLKKRGTALKTRVKAPKQVVQTKNIKTLQSSYSDSELNAMFAGID